MPIKIVTDSTCDLPEKVIQNLGITVVPLYINLFDKGYLDGVEITRKDFYSNLPDYKVHPTTGIPGLNAFTEAYKALTSKGATEILSIHISESLSGTVGAAQTA
ncbi:MAG: DegV family protein, partial [Anaerolineales bacterium]